MRTNMPLLLYQEQTSTTNIIQQCITKRFARLVLVILIFIFITIDFLKINPTLGTYKSLIYDTIVSKAPVAVSPKTETAYALLIDSTEFECHARVLASRLRKMDPKSDVVVMVVNDTKNGRNISIPQANSIKFVPTPVTQARRWWRNTFAKFHVIDLVEYEAVMFLDLDNIVVNSPHRFFEQTSGPIAAPIMYWVKTLPLSSANFIVRPKSPILKEEFAEVFNGSVNGQYKHEMDWFAQKFHNSNVFEQIKDDQLGFTVGEFLDFGQSPINTTFGYKCINTTFGYKYIEQKYNYTSPANVLENATAVHFIAEWKPWSPTVWTSKYKSPEVDKILSLWLEEWKSECDQPLCGDCIHSATNVSCWNQVIFLVQRYGTPFREAMDNVLDAKECRQSI